MNVFFFFYLISTFVLLIIFKRSRPVLLMLVVLLAVLVVVYPSDSIEAAKSGLQMWLYMVLPSLLPFFIINDMMIAARLPDLLGRFLAPIAKVLFGTSGYGSYVFVMSIFSGYPSGARITADLIRQKRISAADGQRILTFCSTSGPLFVIGVVGVMLLGSPAVGYLLLISHISGALLNGLAYRFLGSFSRFQPKSCFKSSQNSNPLNSNSSEAVNVSGIFTDAILKSLHTCGLIGGYVIMFSVISMLLRKIEFFSILEQSMSGILQVPAQLTRIVCSLMEASLEITNGSRILSQIDMDLESKMLLISFLLAFSGFAIIGQASSLLQGTGIKLRPYVRSKLTHGLFSAMVCWLMLKLPFGMDALEVTAVYHQPYDISWYLWGTVFFLILLGYFLYAASIKLYRT